MIQYSIVVPCYNEEKNIELILQAFQDCLKRDDVEVILVNNGSTDGTRRLLEQVSQKYSFLRVVHVEMNQGYGFGILSGLKAAHGNVLGWTHGDLQTHPKDVLAALYVFDDTANPHAYVKGNRKGRKWSDRLFTFGMSLFEFVCLREWLPDINAQPNLFPRQFYETWKNPPHDFSLDLYAFYLAKKQGLLIKRLPVFFPPRIHGHSNWNTSLKGKWKFIKRTILFSLELRKRFRTDLPVDNS